LAHEGGIKSTARAPHRKILREMTLHIKPQYIRPSLLNKLLEGAVDRRADLMSFVKINRRHGALTDAFGRELEFLCRHGFSNRPEKHSGDRTCTDLVDFLVRTARTESVQAELLV
jgi:hypothetical protein